MTSSYKRLVTLQVGVMVEFEANGELTAEQQKSYAETVAANAMSREALLRHHPLGQSDPIAAFLGDDGRFPVEVVPTSIEANIVLVEDEGDWS